MLGKKYTFYRFFAEFVNFLYNVQVEILKINIFSDESSSCFPLTLIWSSLPVLIACAGICVSIPLY